MPSVKYSELEMAMQFAGAGSLLDARACICRETGEIYWQSDDDEIDEEVPADIDDPDRYAEIPGQRDLDLGKRLVLKFAARFLPDAYDDVDDMFRRKGAYARYKDFLSRKGMLEQWYEFEQSAVEQALIEWAESEGFAVEKDSIERAP